MSRTESPPAVLRRRSCWKTFTGADVSARSAKVRRFLAVGCARPARGARPKMPDAKRPRARGLLRQAEISFSLARWPVPLPELATHGAVGEVSRVDIDVVGGRVLEDRLHNRPRRGDAALRRTTCVRWDEWDDDR